MSRSKKSPFFSNIGHEIMLLPETFKNFLILMLNVKQVKSWQKVCAIVACVFERETCFFSHRRREAWLKVEVRKKGVFAWNFRQWWRRSSHQNARILVESELKDEIKKKEWVSCQIFLKTSFTNFNLARRAVFGILKKFCLF